MATCTHNTQKKKKKTTVRRLVGKKEAYRSRKGDKKG